MGAGDKPNGANYGFLGAPRPTPPSVSLVQAAALHEAGQGEPYHLACERNRRRLGRPLFGKGFYIWSMVECRCKFNLWLLIFESMSVTRRLHTHRVAITHLYRGPPLALDADYHYSTLACSRATRKSRVTALYPAISLLLHMNDLTC